MRWKEIRIQIDAAYVSTWHCFGRDPIDQTCDPDWERFGNTQNLRFFGRLGWVDRAVNELSHAGSRVVVDTSTRSLASLAALVGIAMRLFV